MLDRWIGARTDFFDLQGAGSDPREDRSGDRRIDRSRRSRSFSRTRARRDGQSALIANE
jgi:hypothetical protein